jgi:outer membrane protein
MDHRITQCSRRRRTSFAPLALAAVAATVCAPCSEATDLVEVLGQATRGDPVLREAEALRTAALEAKPQARGALFPQVRVAGAIETSEVDGNRTIAQETETVPPEIELVRVGQETSADSWWWQAGLRQTLFRWDQWQRLQRADARVAQAEAQFRAAQQDLMVRVTQRYFDVLAAAETLRAAEATLTAFTRQLEQAERQFKVGLVTIIDVEEARAARDAGTANVIAAKRSLAVSGELLTELTGQVYPELQRPKEDFQVDDPKAAQSEQEWVDTALEQNLNLIAARLGVDIAKSDLRIAQSGHMPTVDLYAATGEFDVSADQTNIDRASGVRTTGPADADGSEDVVGVEVVLPIFTGGVTRSRVREQVQLHRAARERLEANIRAAERATRDAYLTSMADRERVAALRQTVASTQSAQRATERGVEVGTRTTVDLLEARRRAFEAERDYARSRYDYLINNVRLRSTAGVLLPEDLKQINDHLLETVSVQPMGAPRR